MGIDATKRAQLEDLKVNIEIANIQRTATGLKAEAQRATRAIADLQQREAAVAQRELAAGMGDMAFRDPRTGREVARIKSYHGAEPYQPPARTIDTPQYRGAFRQYLRKGESGMKGVALKTLQSGVDSSGGFAVPTSLLQDVAMRLPSAGVVPLLSRHTTNAPTDEAVLPKFVGTDNGYPSALTFTPTGPWSSKMLLSVGDVQTEATFGAAKFPMITFLASIIMTRDLFEDGGIGDLETLIAQLCVETQQATIENYALAGSGVGQPTGILSTVRASGSTDGAVLSVKTSSASALTAAGIEGMFGSLPAQYVPRSSWVMHPTTMQAVMGLVDSQQRPLLTFSGDAAHVYGRPVTLSAFMPTVAAGAYPIVFGDLAGYHWVDRSGLSIKLVDDAPNLAQSNLVALLVTFRGTGTPAEPYRLKAQLVSA